MFQEPPQTHNISMVHVYMYMLHCMYTSTMSYSAHHYIVHVCQVLVHLGAHTCNLVPRLSLLYTLYDL